MIGGDLWCNARSLSVAHNCNIICDWQIEIYLIGDTEREMYITNKYETDVKIGMVREKNSQRQPNRLENLFSFGKFLF